MTNIQFPNFQISKFLIFIIFGILCLLFGALNTVYAATEFVSVIDTAGTYDTTGTGDFDNLSQWESTIQSDLTATTTKVFSYSSASGTLPNLADVQGETSGATASSTFVTSTTTTSQILLTNIKGTFQSGETIYIQGMATSSNYVILSSNGDQAIAVAECRATDGSADTTAVSVDGWTTSVDNYIKIWTDPEDVYGRHNGAWDDGKYRLSVSGSNSLTNIEDYTQITGLQIYNDPSVHDQAGIYNNGPTEVKIQQNIVKGNKNNIDYRQQGIRCINHNGDTIYIMNNIIYDFTRIYSYGIYLTSSYPIFYVYNNTVYNNENGIMNDGVGNPTYCLNNITYNNNLDFLGTYDSNSDYNISSDGTAPGTNSKSSTTVKFLDPVNNDFHLHPDDTVARDVGTSTVDGCVETHCNASLRYDIDGTARGGAFDIGADEVPVEFVSTICENASAGGDCVNMDYSSLSTWEDKVESDLTASTTRVFSGAITGTLNENVTVNLCNGTTDTNIDGLVVATTSDQILIDGITGTSTPVITTSGYIWSDEACASAVNYWTVSGGGDDLGASAQALAKIDGGWSVNDGSGITVDGWETDSDNFIKIYTTTIARHNGKWTTGAYNRVFIPSTNFQGQLNIFEDFIKIDGLQFELNNSAGWLYPRSILIDNINKKNSLEFINNIFKNSINNKQGHGIINSDSDSNIFVSNNIFYGFKKDASSALNLPSNSSKVYNNTIYDCNDGIIGNSNMIAINNLISSTTNPFKDSFNSASNYNATDINDTPSGGGLNNITNATVNFVSTAPGTEDFHLTENNPDLIDAGADLSGDPIAPRQDDSGAAYDIDGVLRVASSSQEVAGWDIGADEVNERTATSTGRWTATSTWSGGYIPRSWETITIPAGIKVTYDAGNLFQDDFEKNAFSGWTGNTSEAGNTKAIDITQSYTGDYGAKFVFDGTIGSNENYYYKTLSADQSTIYYRVNILVESETLANAEETNITEFTTNTETTQVGGISIYDNNGTLELKAYYHNGTALTAFSTNKQIETNTWYTVEFYQKASAGDGEAYFWVNGLEIASTTSLSNSSYPIRRIYAGQYNGTNDEAIIYYLDDIALDSEHRVGYRPTATSTERATAIDYKINDITIADTATLSTGAVIDTDYSYRYPLWVYGDVNVDGTLDQNAKSEIKIKNGTSVEHGIIVSATGKLDVDGTSKVEQDAVIGSVVEDDEHNGYVYCDGNSECYFKYADISYLGDNVLDKTGVHIDNYVDNKTSGEGFWMIGNRVYNSYNWLNIYGKYILIKDNEFYGNNHVGIEFHGSQSIISGNKIYSDTYYAIRMNDYQDAYNIINNNIIINTNSCSAGIDFSQQSHNWAYNNTIIGMNNSYSSGIIVATTYDVIKNNILGYNARGIYVAGDSYKTGYESDNNVFYGNSSAIGYWGSDGNIIALSDWQSTTGQDSNSTSTDPLFFNFDNTPAGNDTGGVERSVSSATASTLSASSPGWTVNRWKGYTVWTDDDFSTPTGTQFRYILSNTTDTLTIAGSWDTTPTASYEFKIIDFTLSANSPALGTGATTTPNITAGEINIGAITDYSYSATDSKAYNSMQLAHDNDSTGAGDTITTYTKNLLTDTIDGAVTSIGNDFYYFTADTDITQNDAYNGYYLYVTAGADRGKYYLITDTASSTDTLYIFDDTLQADLNDNDGFIVVDRVYDRVGYVYNVDNFDSLRLSKDGDIQNPITWNTNGTVILEGDTSKRYGVDFSYLYSNIVDGFIIRGYKNSPISADNQGGGNAIVNNIICDNLRGGIGISYNNNPDGQINNNSVFNNQVIGIFTSENSVVDSNIVYNNGGTGIYIKDNTLAKDNKVFGTNYINTGGIETQGRGILSSNNSTIKNNIVLGSEREGIYTYSGDNNNILNNVSIANGYDGFERSTVDGIDNTIRNNIFAFNGGYGVNIIGGASTGNTTDFNYFYGNTLGTTNGIAIGTSSIESTVSPNFKSVDTGTADTNSTVSMIIDAGQNWTANKFVGYGVKITISGTEYWAGVTSNTSDRLYLAPDLGVVPVVGDNFIITDFSITGTSTATTTPLGNGASADGTTESGNVNMGAITDFSKNIVDDTVFNSMQDAHDDAGLSPGDTVTTYAVNEVENGVTGTSTDLGLMIKVEVNESAIAEDNQYEGMYLYMEAGENRGKYYLIVDSDENTVDTVTLLTDSTDGFSENDVFTIVDRIYDKKFNSNNLLYLDTAGTADNPIEWNAEGNVILNGQGVYFYAIHTSSGADYNVINGFRFCNFRYGGILGYADSITSKNNKFFDITSGVAIHFSNYSLAENNYFTRVRIAIDMNESNIAMGNIINATYAGIYFNGGSNNLAVDNSIFGVTSYDGIRFIDPYNTARNNKIFANRMGVWFYDAATNYNSLENNTIVGSEIRGIFIGGVGNIIKNNIIANSGTYGYENYGTTDSNDNDFNYYYNNSSGDLYNDTIGTSSITGHDPNFVNLVSSTVDTNSTTISIVDTTQSWTPNQWTGYGFKITIAGTDYWAGITSNTSDRLYLAPALDVLPSVGDAYMITDFSIGSTTATTTPLGQGCSADGTTEPGIVNMGAQLGYTYNANINSGTKYNNIQNAHDDSNLSSGDDVLVYAIDELSSGTVSTTIDLGPMISISVDEASFTADNDYAGMYMYMLTGTNQYEHYLIATTDENTTDTITIVTDTASSTFTTGDTFRIVDRIYASISNPNTPTNPSANLSLTKSGTNLSDRIQFSSNGTVIIDAKLPVIARSGATWQSQSTTNYNITDTQGLKFIKLNNFQLSNASIRAIVGNTLFQTTGTGYETDYCWPSCADSATEFISTVDPGNGADTDFTSLYAWEAATQGDISAVNTFVFSISTSTGIIPIGSTLIGETSGATASSTYYSTGSAQTLLYNITPNNANTFQSGEKVYIEGSSTTTNYMVLGDAGNMAIATAKCRTTDGTSDTNAVVVDGWTTSAANYIKIWTDPNDPYGRHNGVWNEGNYRLEVTNLNAITIEENYVRLDGLQVYVAGTGTWDYNIYAGVYSGLMISGNIIKGTSGDYRTGIRIDAIGADDIYVWNNIIYNFDGISSTGINIGSNDENAFVYNNTIYNCDIGIATGYNDALLYNNLIHVNTNAYNGTFAEGCDYNATNLDHALNTTGSPESHNKKNQTFNFLNEANNNFHLELSDTAAKDAGVDLSDNATISFTLDIDGNSRGGAWDIGADEAATQFISTIMETGGDFNSLSTWEAEVNTDLMSSSTLVYSGSATGGLPSGSTVTLYRSGTFQNITGIIVSTSTTQILIDDINNTADNGSTWTAVAQSGDEWRIDASNLWTVSGTGDELGAPVIAVAKIDGTWTSPDTTAVEIDGWETGIGNYIKIYTTESARHSGKWSDVGYRLEANTGNARLDIFEDFVNIEGIQAALSGSDGAKMRYLIRYNITESKNNKSYISNNIFKGGITGSQYHYGLLATTNRSLLVYNNIFYNFNSDSANRGYAVNLTSNIYSYVYNNTFYNNYYGIAQVASGNIIVKNNLMASTTDGFNGTFAVGSDFNLSDIVGDAPGSNSQNGVTVSFISTSTEDFRLASDDVYAKNKGVNLSNDPHLAFNTDIEGQIRESAWDIGADETTAVQTGIIAVGSKTDEDDLTNGLVGHWTFNEMSGTIVKDISGNGNNGTWQGTGSYWNNNSRFGSGGEFNGNGDYVDLNSPTSLDDINTFTYSAWVKTSESENWSPIIQKGNGSNAKKSLYYNSSDGDSLRRVGGVFKTNGVSASSITANNSYSLTGWDHVVMSYDDGSDRLLKIYLNGKEASYYSQTSATGTAEIDASDEIWFGSIPSTEFNYFKGNIDEIRIYNRVLTQREIVQLYNQNKAVVEWHFRNNYNDTGTLCEINPTNCKNLTAGGTGNALAGGYLEESTTALALNGAGYATLADDAYFNIASTSDFSFVATIKTSDTANSVVISKRTSDASTNAGYLLGLDYGQGDGIPFFEVSDGVDEFSIYGNESVADGEWHTIIAVFDDDSVAGNKIYIDGQDKTGGTNGTLSLIDSLVNSTALNIGRTNDNLGLFTGSIDRVAFFPYALTRADVLRENANGASVQIGQQTKDTTNGVNYDPFGGAPPVAWWKLDEMSGTTAKDSSGSGLDGTWNGGGSHFKNGKVGMSGSFNGSDDYIDIGTSDILQENGALTINGWIYPYTVGENDQGRIIFRENVDYTYYGISFHLMPTNVLAFQVNGETTLDRTTIDNSITLNRWQHVSVTWDGSTSASNVHIYINGIEASYQTTTNGSVLTDTFGGNTYIGNRVNTNRAFNGQIDDVKIYDYARTPAQIAWDYNRGAPIAHWKFDEASSGSADGATLIDSSGNNYRGTGNDGANNTGLNWTNGKFGNALDFDGVDDTVTANLINFSSSDLITISLWIKPDEINALKNIIKIGDTNGHAIWQNTSGGFYAGTVFASGWTTVTSNNSVLTQTQWQNIIYTYDGINQTLYLNGQKIKTNPIAEEFNSSPTGDIGISGNSNYNGQIDEIRLYNYALTDDMTKEVYNNGRVYFGN